MRRTLEQVEVNKRDNLQLAQSAKFIIAGFLQLHGKGLSGDADLLDLAYRFESDLVDVEAGDRVLVRESDDVSYYGAGGDELHLVFNFPLMFAQCLTPAHVRANQDERLAPFEIFVAEVGSHPPDRHSIASSS